MTTVYSKLVIFPSGRTAVLYSTERYDHRGEKRVLVELEDDHTLREMHSPGAVGVVASLDWALTDDDFQWLVSK